jgi:hypothetical protein
MFPLSLTPHTSWNLLPGENRIIIMLGDSRPVKTPLWPVTTITSVSFNGLDETFRGRVTLPSQRLVTELASLAVDGPPIFNMAQSSPRSFPEVEEIVGQITFFSPWIRPSTGGSSFKNFNPSSCLEVVVVEAIAVD